MAQKKVMRVPLCPRLLTVPFLCHPQVPWIAYSPVSHALVGGMSGAEKGNESTPLPPRTDSTFPLLGAGGKFHPIREGMRVLYFSAPLCW